MSGFMQDPTAIGAKGIGLEDSFHFKRNACGNCCRGRMNDIDETGIFLSGPDIWRIMEFTNLSFADLLDRHINVRLDPDLKIQVCSLRFKYSGVCTFLKKGRCSIYEARPRTCSLYPLGRAILFKQIGNEFVHYEDTYVVSDPDSNYECDNQADDRYTINEWLARNNVPLNDKEDIEWFKLVTEFSYRANKKKLQAIELKKIFNDLYQKGRD